VPTRAWPQLKELAELLEAPVTTSLQGKVHSSHALSLGSAAARFPSMHEFLNNTDLIFGIGCSFSILYGVAMPKGARIARHARPG
jgi:thiamine pyrophosphate-dependent acetolactate synthase large subunit-like protein